MKKSLGKVLAGAAIVAASVLGMGVAPASAAYDCGPGLTCFWLDENYSGGKGSFLGPTNQFTSTFDAKASSLHNRQSLTARTWSGQNLTGTARNWGANFAANSLGSYGWNDRIRSFDKF